jgi:hypothetical protein
MATDIRQLETHLRHTIKVAMAAQEKLSAARNAAGLRDPQSIYTAAEVKELRVEFHQEWVAFFKAQHSGEYSRVGQLAFEALSKKQDNVVSIKKGK